MNGDKMVFYGYGSCFGISITLSANFSFFFSRVVSSNGIRPAIQIVINGTNEWKKFSVAVNGLLELR
jgi:hypothetical protein